MKAKNYLRAVSLLLILLFLSEIASASMRCGTSQITAGERNRTSQAEVVKKCGTPYSKSGGTWIYVKGNQVYRLKFGEGGLKEVYSEIKR